MNRNLIRPLIVVCIIFVAIIVAGFIIRDVVTTHTITVDEKGGVPVLFYQVLDDAENTEINKQVLSKTTVLSVKDGDYCATPTNTDYDISPICITVKGKNTTLTVDPSFSTSHLNQLLTGDLQGELKSLIATKYQPIIDQFSIDDGYLYNKGEYYGTTLTVKVSPQDRGDVYRIILKKNGNIWSVIVPPQLALNKYDYPAIPFNVLTSVNTLPGNS